MVNDFVSFESQTRTKYLTIEEQKNKQNQGLISVIQSMEGLIA